MKQENGFERLDRVLANNGYGTRREVRKLVHRGRVAVNGGTVLNEDCHIRIGTDSITVDGEAVAVRTNCYLMMNKAAGYVCSSVSNAYPTVYSLLAPQYRRKFLGGEVGTVGRLDADAEGLLIFTSDGDLNHRLSSPRRRIPKTYLVHLRDAVDARGRESYSGRLAAGVHIPAEDRAAEADCRPAEIAWIPEAEGAAMEGAPAAACYLTVYEGKFHEVKRLFAALGNEVLYLKRVSVNGLKLDESLAPGGCRELTEGELALLEGGAVND